MWTKTKHLLDLDLLTTDEVLHILTEAKHLRDTQDEQKETLAPNSRRMLLCFFEDSTRTRLSFEIAAQKLGMHCVNLLPQIASLSKGESLRNTVRTIQSLGADLIVVRHPAAGVPYLIARHTDVITINAGDGPHAHPTQTLSDLMTIQEYTGQETLEGVRVAIVGDLLHSRVSRSLMIGLAKLKADVSVTAPSSMLPRHITPNSSGGPGTVQFIPDLDEAIQKADVVYVLRVHRERHSSTMTSDARQYAADYAITKRHLELNSNLLVLHPGPVNEGIDVTYEVLNSPQSQVEKQAQNGVYVRMAVTKLLCEGQAVQ